MLTLVNLKWLQICNEQVTCEYCQKLKDHLEATSEELKSAHLIIKLLQEEIKTQRGEYNDPSNHVASSKSDFSTCGTVIGKWIPVIHSSHTKTSKVRTSSTKTNLQVVPISNRFAPLADLKNEALVWESVGLMVGRLYSEVSVVFKNVQFHRATNIPKEGNIEFTVMVQKGSGKFEVAEDNTAVVTGSVQLPENISRETVPLDPSELVHGDDLLELTSRDIYKELRLRGYNYHGLFRSLLSMDNLGRSGNIRWCNNWVAFMDNMLQTDILSEDTRGLFVPTSLQKLTIDTKQHVAILHSLAAENNEVVVPVYNYKEAGIIRSGGIEVRGLKASAIARRKPLGMPVLEKYVFVPNLEPESLDLHTALRACIHIVLENQLGNHVKTIELPHPDTMPLSPTVALILGDLPLIQADITVLANKGNPLVVDLDMTGIKVEDRNLMAEQNCTLIIASNILFHTELLQTANSILAEGACILAREEPNTKLVGTRYFGFETVFEKTLQNEKFILLRKEVVMDDPAVIHVSSQNYDWLPQLQEVIGKSSKHRVLLVAQGEPLSGILGLVNCIRKEPGGESIRCVFILDTSAPAFDVDVPLYRHQLEKDLVMNVYSNGQWGSYRHLPLDSYDTVPVPHAYVNVTTRGDLSSLKWIEGKLQPDSISSKEKEEFIHVYYAALNFRDVMTATGKLAVEVACNSRLNEDCIQGLEYAGCDVNGRRVMGMGEYGYMATMVLPDKDFLWNVPEHWTLEEAATVPVVYGTVYYALLITGQMKKGDSVLIHAGSGGVGQAAINICLHAGCTVYTTVGTQEKREFIKKQFPQLTDRNIGNSRDTSFEQLIMLETNGKGVDLILNSLSEEKLQASVRCLAIGGRFLEIGKFDLSNNKSLGMEMFLKGTSFHGVMLDLLYIGSSEVKKTIHDSVEEGIKSGAVKPLVRTVFAADEVEHAFRYMAAGKHIGKVLLRIRQEEDGKGPVPSLLLMQACPRYHCNPACTYIITGGLGGFGLELADWLVLRGARKLVLTSRHGLKTGYQSLRVRTWRWYGTTVVISVTDITTRTGVASLLSDANKLGPIDAIFHLAVILKDALLQNQSEADFAASAGPKAQAALYLDELSRQMCPQLRHFVVFSSVSCGRGNAGQTNYGMNNSVMERICEARVRDGFPGLAVQWGAVGDVGLVADMQEDNMEIVIGGTLSQKISSCLEVLNGFMKQSYPVVASMVVAEKRGGSAGSGTIVDCVSNILGIHDLKTVSLHSTLAELGMDSMMAVEIKQSLEREFEVFLTAQEIRSLTFARLAELSAAKEEPQIVPEEQPPAVPLEGLELLLQAVGDEETAAQSVLHLPSAVGMGKDIEDMAKTGPVLFMIPGVEGMGSILEPLARNLKYQTLCLQLGYSNLGDTAQDMAQALFPHIRARLAPEDTFNLLGYSFGGILALELALALEAEGLKGHVYLVDSSPVFLQTVQERAIGRSEDQFEIKLICIIFNLVAPHEATPTAVSQLVEDLTPLKSWDERLEHFIRMFPNTNHSMKHLKAVGAASYTRLKAISSYKWGHKTTIKSHITLLRPTIMALQTQEDYGLSQYCDKEVQVHFVTGNHVTLLESTECATIINQHVVDNEDVTVKKSVMSEGNK